MNAAMSGAHQWPTVKLSDVADMCLGKMLDAKKNKGRPLPYLRNPNVRWLQIDLTDTQEMLFEDHEQERYGLRDGDVLVCEGGEAGRAAIWNGQISEMKFQKALHRIRCGSNLHNRFLVHRLMADYFSGRLSDYYTGATIKHLTGQDLGRYSFTLPPVAEQRRIAAILDKADALRAKRRAAIAQLDMLTQSIFLDMFGDPVMNPKGWECLRLGEVAEFYAGSTLPHGIAFDEQEGGYFLLKVSDMNLPGNETYIRTSQQWSSAAGQPASTCPAGSVVIPKRGGAIGTNKKRITTRDSILDPNLMAICPQARHLDVQFLYHWLLRLDLSSLASGSSVPQLNKRDLEPVDIPIPPLALQAEFSSQLDAVEKVRVRFTASGVSVEELFSALQYRAFERGL